MGKGILMEVEGRTGIVLTPGGEFKRVPLPRREAAFDIGDEIAFEERSGLRWGWLAAAAAVILMLLSPVAYQSISLAQPMALVLIDINPSIQLTVNGRQQVVEAVGLNEDGQEVLKSVTWQKRSVDEVTRAVTAQAVAAGKLDPSLEGSAVVVAVAPLGEKVLPEQVAGEIVDRSRSAVQAEVKAQAEAKGQEARAQVAAVAATPQEVKQAKEQGLTVPKLIIVEEVKVSHPEVTVSEELLKEPPGQILRNLGLNPGEIFGKAELRHNKKDEKDQPASLKDRPQPNDAGDKPDDRKGDKKDDKRDDKDDKRDDKDDKRDDKDDKRDDKDDKRDDKDDMRDDKDDEKDDKETGSEPGEKAPGLSDVLPPGLGDKLPPGLGDKLPPGLGDKIPPGLGDKVPPGLGDKIPPGLGDKVPPGLGGKGPSDDDDDEKRSDDDKRPDDEDDKRSDKDEKRSDDDDKRSDNDKKRSDAEDKRSDKNDKRSGDEDDESRSENDRKKSRGDDHGDAPEEQQQAPPRANPEPSNEGKGFLQNLKEWFGIGGADAGANSRAEEKPNSDKDGKEKRGSKANEGAKEKNKP